jgi:hypothetical protein
LKTVILEARLDACLLAGILRFLEERDIRANSRSEAITLMSEHFATLLDRVGMPLLIPDSDDSAISYIQRYFGDKDMLVRRNARMTRAKEVYNEAILESGYTPPRRERKIVPVKLDEDEKKEIINLVKKIEYNGQTVQDIEKSLADEDGNISAEAFALREQAEKQRIKEMLSSVPASIIANSTEGEESGSV